MPAPQSLDDAAPAALSFAALGVPAPMARALERRGLTEPFPIQAATIPDALAGRDLCGAAPTGSGKTIAFGIPLVLRAGKARPRRPRGLVLVPTRELASQVAYELQQLSKPDGPWVEAFYGGVGFPKQVQALQRGVDIAVACPGRLADLLNQGCADLRDVGFVVVDEADRMADMGFLPEVRRILDQCADTRQTLLFSATLDGDVDVLVRRYQRNPVRHEQHRDIEDARRATHLFWTVERTERVHTAAALVSRAGPTVVFCRTKRGADRVARQLAAAGVPAAAIHGDRSQAQRETALRALHRGEVLALVATDVAARGIHVDDVACVIHFDPPQEAKDYVHRSGRTARAGASGLVVSLVIPDVRRDVKRLQIELGHDEGFTPAVPESIAQHAGVRTPAAGRDADRKERTTPTTRPAPERRRRSRKDRTSASAARAPERRPSDRVIAGPPRGEREPLPEGARRPSGAARRKAKRLAEREAAMLAGAPGESGRRRSERPGPKNKRGGGKATASTGRRSAAHASTAPGPQGPSGQRRRHGRPGAPRRSR